MQSRVYRFMVGIEQSAQPDPGVPVDPADIVPLDYLSTYFAQRRKVTSTFAAPYLAVDGTSIAHGMTSAYSDCVMYLKSTTGVIDMTAVPQIAAGTSDGQVLHLIFTSDADTVLLETGNGLHMPQGSVRSLLGTHLTFHWDAGSSLWRNSYWNGIGAIL